VCVDPNSPKEALELVEISYRMSHRTNLRAPDVQCHAGAGAVADFRRKEVWIGVILSEPSFAISDRTSETKGKGK
jgi:hypothetical protein